MKIRRRTLVFLLPLLLPMAIIASAYAPIVTSSDLYLPAEDSTLFSIEPTKDPNVDGTSDVTSSSESQCLDGTDLYSSMEGKMFEGNSFNLVELTREQTHLCPLISPPLAAEFVKPSMDSFRAIRTGSAISGFWAGLVSVLGIIVRRQSGSSPFSRRFKRRSRIDVFAEILRVSVAGTRKTRIIQSANLNSRIVEGYLATLERTGLLQRPIASPSIFVTTTKGQLFLLLYLRINELLDREIRSLKTHELFSGRGEIPT